MHSIRTNPSQTGRKTQVNNFERSDRDIVLSHSGEGAHIAAVLPKPVFKKGFGPGFKGDISDGLEFELTRKSKVIWSLALMCRSLLVYYWMPCQDVCGMLPAGLVHAPR